jgi:hypothetical protein
MHKSNIFLDVFEVLCLSQPLSTTHEPKNNFQNDPGKSGIFKAEIDMGDGGYMEQAHTKSGCTFNIVPCQHAMMVTQYVGCWHMVGTILPWLCNIHVYKGGVWGCKSL